MRSAFNSLTTYDPSKTRDFLCSYAIEALRKVPLLVDHIIGLRNAD